MVMLGAYLDESGTDGPVFLYAGFVGNADAWIDFSEAWAACCGPSIPDFHMVEAIRLKSGYWGQGSDEELIERRDRKLMELAEIIAGHAMFRINSGIDWARYQEILAGKVPAEFDHPLFFGMVALLGELSRWHQGDHVPDKIDLVFDCNSFTQTRAAGWYQHIVEHIDPAAAHVFSGPPAFRKDSDVLPLKAADMLAWQMRRHVAERSKVPDGKAAMRPELARLLNIPYREANLPTWRLREIAKTLSGEPVAVLKPEGPHV